MTDEMDDITSRIAGMRRAHEALDSAVAGLTDEQARQPCLLPGWSVGHLLTHIARNADSVVRRFDGVLRGEVVDQYVGGREGREADIEAGAHRTARELVDDVRQSSEAANDICARMPADAWNAPCRSVTGSEMSAAHVLLSRWREVEVHHVDLGLGYTHADWPADMVEACLPGVLDSLLRRTDKAQLMAWAMNRAAAPDVESWG
jgi:maleylpyruvate isomerase